MEWIAAKRFGECGRLSRFVPLLSSTLHSSPHLSRHQSIREEHAANQEADAQKQGGSEYLKRQPLRSGTLGSLPFPPLQAIMQCTTTHRSTPLHPIPLLPPHTLNPCLIDPISAAADGDT